MVLIDTRAYPPALAMLRVLQRPDEKLRTVLAEGVNQVPQIAAVISSSPLVWCVSVVGYPAPLPVELPGAGQQRRHPARPFGGRQPLRGRHTWL
ncbi:MAG: hypothetical protein M3256_27240 [Actinomycetota bacterium]|nr:hypothetical protein [Actinomycetota bacterium]